MRHSEKSIRTDLYIHLAPDSIASLPRVRLSGWEADILDVTHAGHCHEYEIKCSRNDFLSDFKKPKHAVLRGIHKNANGGKLKKTANRGKLVPNCFWFVTADGIIDHKEVPDYAGWMEVRRDRSGAIFFEVHKEAPRLHSEKLGEGGLKDLLTEAQNKLWSLMANEMDDED